jgi:AcrR family transcriptional regulator
MDRRERKKQQTRALIEETALNLFAERGYRDTTIGAIAEAADVAVRTVTVHFPTKEDLLFGTDPFAADLLAARIRDRAPDESTLDAVRDWMATTMASLTEDGPGRDVWRRRALRVRVITTDDALRARARAGYYQSELPVAAGIGADLGLPADALAPRLAATTIITGLRELYETREAAETDTAELLSLVDRVLDFARAGLTAIARDKSLERVTRHPA